MSHIFCPFYSDQSLTRQTVQVSLVNSDMSLKQLLYFVGIMKGPRYLKSWLNKKLYNLLIYHFSYRLIVETRLSWNIFLCQGFAKSESIMGAILALSPCFQRMLYIFVTDSTISGNTMHTKYFSFSFQVQCNVVFVGKFNFVTCQNLCDGFKKYIIHSIWLHQFVKLIKD